MIVKFIPCPCSFGICDECIKNDGEYNPAIDYMVQSIEESKDASREPQKTPDGLPF